MKKVTAALAVLLALTLSGCASATGNAAEERTAPAVTETVEPLVAESPTAEPEATSTEPEFIALVRDSLPANTLIPDATDEQLIAAGTEACELIRTGTNPADIRLIEGEQPNGADIYADTSAIMNSALLALCPELI